MLDSPGLRAPPDPIAKFSTADPVEMGSRTEPLAAGRCDPLPVAASSFYRRSAPGRRFGPRRSSNPLTRTAISPAPAPGAVSTETVSLQPSPPREEVEAARARLERTGKSADQLAREREARNTALPRPLASGCLSLALRDLRGDLEPVRNVDLPEIPVFPRFRRTGLRSCRSCIGPGLTRGVVWQHPFLLHRWVLEGRGAAGALQQPGLPGE